MPDRLSSIARLQFLGAQRVEIGNEVLTPDAERLFAMIVRLSVPLGRMTSRQTMLDTLWPGWDDANARHNLRQTVYKAREMGLVIESGEDGLRLDPRHWSCDWEDPVGEVGGEWLAGYEPGFSDELTSWVTAQRLGVHALIRPRIVRSLQNARSAGDMQAANRYAVQLLGIDELNEEAILTRAEVMAMQGAKVDALKLLDTYLSEIGRVGAGRDAALPAQLLRRRIAEKLPAITYQSGSRHHGPLVGRVVESRVLTAGLFDARGGRGTGFLVHGPEGSGKSRLLHELRTSAVLQGMRVLEHVCTSEPSATPFTMLRALVQRLLQLPGALGVSPDGLAVLRGWVVSREFAPDDCPLAEIEDLLGAVSEETPLLLQVEHAERIDAESLGRLDRIYRRGVTRHHLLVLTSSAQRTPTESPVALQWITPVPLRPMTTVDVRSVITAWAASEKPLATQDQIACAAVFAEGIPMYGIEMLGLMLDPGSPDVIPWRVQVAVDRAVRELSEVQWRVLSLAQTLGDAATEAVMESVVLDRNSERALTMQNLEDWGFATVDDGIVRTSALMAVAASEKLTSYTLRSDAVTAANFLIGLCDSSFQPKNLYASLRALALAKQWTVAISVLDKHASTLLRTDSADNIVFQLSKVLTGGCSDELRQILQSTVDQVRSGSQVKRPTRRERNDLIRASSLPISKSGEVELHHQLAKNEILLSSLAAARNPNEPVAGRLAEAVVALTVASNHENEARLEEAYLTVSALRCAEEAPQYEIARADTIYFTSKGLRSAAIASAKELATASREMADVFLACKGLRNAAEACVYFGESALANQYILDSRRIATALSYHAQIAWADIKLASLCLDRIDIEGLKAYLRSAEEIAIRHGALSPLVEIDIQLLSMWEALLSGDPSRAQKCSRTITRRLSKAEKQGTALWTILGAKLAIRRGPLSAQSRQEIKTLRMSVERASFYPNENVTIASLLLTTIGTDMQMEIHDFARKLLPRIKDRRGEVWPIITRLLSGEPFFRDGNRND